MLLIYLPKNSPRCKYAFELIFTEEFGIEYQITNDRNEFKIYQGEKINYSSQRIAAEFFIKANDILWENEIRKQDIKVAEKEETKVLFPSHEDDLGFDIFAAVFFMISRYEEYLPFAPDKFGRFKACDSIAFQNDFLQKPVVNIWIGIFRKALKFKFEKLVLRTSSFKAILTYDIDVAYKFKGRSFGRTIGSSVKDLFGLHLQNLKERLQMLSPSKKDPWDVYDELKRMIIKNQLSSIFFFLLADKSAHDRNLHFQNQQMKKLVQEIKTFSEIGIHPSFYSSSFPQKIPIEKQRLEKLSGQKINKSRQHYLKFKLPDTYNSLLLAGITEDYSMGFAGEPGFRAGTCKPFYFYDLENEKVNDLKIFPLTFMEGTLINNFDPGKALHIILELIKEVKSVGGIFIPLWHNHTVSDTDQHSAWKKVHGQMIQRLVFTLNES